MLGEKHNLADVMGVVADLAIDGLHDRMRLGANGDGAGQVIVTEPVQRIEADFQPASQRATRAERVGGGVSNSVSRWRSGFSPSLVKIGPRRAHVAGHVLDDDGEGVGFGGRAV